MDTNNNTPKVYGNRTCRHCKGICHEGSIRDKVGTRKAYYCSEQCLRYSETNKLWERIQKLNKKYNGRVSRSEAVFTDSFWADHLNQFYEKVFVISK